VRVAACSAAFAPGGMPLVFPGFLRAWGEGSADAQAALDQRERLLPPLEKGDVLSLVDLVAQAHETRPPPRYTEASLIRFMEREGIGRASTFATIFSTIIERRYVTKHGNQPVPTYT